MAKDKKAKAAEKKQRVAQKNEKKTAQKEKKAARKPARSGADADDDSDDSNADLDALLASYAAEQERFLKITESAAGAPPSPRGSATLIASPANEHELLLFGGEHYDGALARFYSDLYVYHAGRDEWRLVTSPNAPLPRSGHAWTRGGNAGGVWLFGGEFSSPKQGTFYHYSDFWRLDPASREWTKIEAVAGKGKGSGGSGSAAPSARSGHRMTYFKNYIVLFGGFQDTSQQTKYLNDLWLYDCQNFMWHCPTLPPASQKPDPRSSFSLLPHELGAVLYGGYSRVKVSTTMRPTKGGRGAQRDVMKPVVHQDTWFLRITPPASESPAGAPPTVRWERRKRPANAPNPPRAGATMAFHRGRGIQFGGVHDVENSEEGIESEFFNTLYVWNIERNRFFSLALRRPRTGKKTVPAAERSKRGRGKADEEELLKNLAALEMRHGVGGDEKEQNGQLQTQTPEEDEETTDTKLEKPVYWEMPSPRFNALLAVSQNDILYIFGGTFEKGDQEFTFDEMYSIDLGKLDGVKEIFRTELEAWKGSDSEDSDDEDEDEDISDDDTLVESTDEPPKDQVDYESFKSLSDRQPIATTSMADTELMETEDDVDIEEGPNGSVLDDKLPQPRPFETLRDFYARTSQQWQAMLLENSSERGNTNSKSGKEVRKGAFDLAEERWWDCREVIQAMEEEQEEAGIGEIVSLADRATDNPNGVRRR